MAIFVVALALSGSYALAKQLPATIPDFTSCLSEPGFYSCENTTAIQNTCCSPTPGGLVVQTQIWSTHTGFEKKGQLLPKDSWTIHGLWPDNCDGSYESYCDLTRQYDPNPVPATLPDGTSVPPWKGESIDKWIKDFGRKDLLDFMNNYWVSSESENPVFWAHEFSKHATCTSTFDLECYGDDYEDHADVINFFDATVRAYQQYPTFDMLAAVGIVPSNTTAYPLSDIENALKLQLGVKPYVSCTSNTTLSEIWYLSHVYGTEQYGAYKNLDSTSKSSCSTTEPIWYHERTKKSEHEVRK